MKNLKMPGVLGKVPFIYYLSTIWVFFYPLPLTLIGISYENKKDAHLQHHLGASFIRLNELGKVSN